MHFVAVKVSQIPAGLGIYSSVKNSAFTAVIGGVICQYKVYERGTKGVSFLSQMVYKRVRGGAKVGSLRITLCWVLPYHYVTQRVAVWFLLLVIVTFYTFCFLSYSIGMLPFSLYLSPLSTLSFIFHVKHHVAALDQLKHSCTIGSFPVRWWEGICPISWRICKLLAVFISLTIMGWLNLLTKCLIM